MTLTTEQIDVIRERIRISSPWNPTVGDEAKNLLNTLDLDNQGKQNVLSESLQILSKSAQPGIGIFSNTGLVLGYVQSGKTMSFTTVSALARDNGYALVILITGIANNLFNQSNNRIRTDLSIASRNDRAWSMIENPDMQSGEAVETILSDWRDDSLSTDQKQTVFISVLKNHRRLQSLADLLGAIDLSDLSVLIIDDEADQASLNNRVNEDEESTTYARIVSLRNAIPRHTYLQYTATPQAPLLISIIDQLSPGFTVVLTPGATYTGGRDFFADDSLIRIIPDQEVPARNNHLHEPPASLLSALRMFYLSVAAGHILDQARKNRSMMVHPSRLTSSHADYAQWLREIRNEWLQFLELEDNNLDKIEFVELFRPAYEDLALTATNCPRFEELLPLLTRVVRRTLITEVNASRGRTPEINWDSSYSHILVGGQALDRGFTILGLTTTYMPRGVGGGSADTLQQRARFFGYKRSYINFCRIFLESESGRLFRAYVDHEESVRGSLREHIQIGGTLRDWKRAFLLDTALSPTRTSVISSLVIQDNYSNKWFSAREAHIVAEVVAANNLLIGNFLRQFQFSELDGDARRSRMQIPLLSPEVSLARVYEQLLVQYRLVGQEDSQKFVGVLLQIKKYLDENADATVDIYQIGSGEIRNRTLVDRGRLGISRALFQGANLERGNVVRGEIYPGDFEIKSNERLTLQVHNIQPLDDDGTSVGEPLLLLVLWIPQPFSNGWLVQDQ